MTQPSAVARGAQARNFKSLAGCLNERRKGMDENSMTEPAQEFGAAVSGDALDGDQQKLILSLPVPVQVVLGSTTMSVANLMKLGRGAVVTLDKRVGDVVDIMVSGRLVARGEVVVLDEADSRYGVSLTEIVSASSNRPT